MVGKNYWLKRMCIRQMDEIKSMLEFENPHMEDISIINIQSNGLVVYKNESEEEMILDSGLDTHELSSWFEKYKKEINAKIN